MAAPGRAGGAKPRAAASRKPARSRAPSRRTIAAAIRPDGTVLDAVRVVTTALAALGAALVAGFFWAYAVSVLPGLTLAPPASAIAAMQAINAVVRTPLFGAGFFGALVAGGAAAAASLALFRRDGSWIVLAGFALYVVGVMMVTSNGSVPLNDILAEVGPDAPDPDATWHAYVEPWAAWNWIRTMAALGAAALYLLALVRMGREARAP